MLLSGQLWGGDIGVLVSLPQPFILSVPHTHILPYTHSATYSAVDILFCCIYIYIYIHHSSTHY